MVANGGTARLTSHTGRRRTPRLAARLRSRTPSQGASARATAPQGVAGRRRERTSTLPSSPGTWGRLLTPCVICCELSGRGGDFEPGGHIHEDSPSGKYLLTYSKRIRAFPPSLGALSWRLVGLLRRGADVAVNRPAQLLHMDLLHRRRHGSTGTGHVPRLQIAAGCNPHRRAKSKAASCLEGGCGQAEGRIKAKDHTSGCGPGTTVLLLRGARHD